MGDIGRLPSENLDLHGNRNLLPNHNMPSLPPCPANEADYQATVEALDAVLDAGSADETHLLASLADYLGNLVEAYEAEHHPV